MNEKGILLIVSGPSGSGKGTVIGELRKMRENLGFSVSATTRAPRAGEEDGVNYYFLSRDDFEDMLAQGEILEHNVYNGNYYGTLRSEVERVLSVGHDLILEIDINGQRQIKKLFPDCVSVMILPPSMEELSRRLHSRATESEEVIAARLSVAAEEIAQADKYDYILINETGKIEECAARMNAILDTEQYRYCRMAETVKKNF